MLLTVATLLAYEFKLEHPLHFEQKKLGILNLWMRAVSILQTEIPFLSVSINIRISEYFLILL